MEGSKHIEIDSLYIQTVKSLVDQLVQLVLTASVEYRAAVREHLATSCHQILKCLEEDAQSQQEIQSQPASETEKIHSSSSSINSSNSTTTYCSSSSSSIYSDEATCFNQICESTRVNVLNDHENKHNHDPNQSTQYVDGNSVSLCFQTGCTNISQSCEFKDTQSTDHYTSFDKLETVTPATNGVALDETATAGAVSSGSTVSATAVLTESCTAGESAKKHAIGDEASNVETVKKVNVSGEGDDETMVTDEDETGVISMGSLQEKGDNQQQDTTFQEDVCEVDGQLLSFLPQLSVEQLQDGNNEGFIHLTVERADGSVQNLKIARVNTADVVNTVGVVDMADVDNTASTELEPAVDPSERQGVLNEESKASPTTVCETNEREGAAVDRPAKKGRPRGRPKKPPIFQTALTEDNELVYTCPVCPDVVKTQHAMTVHMRKHTGEKPWRCGTCGRAFSTKGNMRQHETTTHSSAKPWSCTTCGKTFKEKKVLMVHERIHSGERPYRCDICGKSFTQGGVLKEHMLIHSGRKPHLCDLCGQEFRGASALKMHKLRHLDKKDFKCDQCSRQFIAKNDLKRHIATHSGIKPYLCSECPKSFTRLTYLHEHLNLHRGLKPHTCPHCPATFAETSALHRHKQKKHADILQHRNKQSELERELTSGSLVKSGSQPGEMGNPAQGPCETSVQLVFDDAANNEEFQRLQSLVLSASNADFNLSGADPVKQIYQVLCVNPDTQEISSIPQVEAQGTTDFSAINLLARATTQQYTLK